MVLLLTIASFVVLVALALIYLSTLAAVGISLFGILIVLIVLKLYHGLRAPAEEAELEMTEESSGCGTVRCLLAQLPDSYAVFVDLHRQTDDFDYLVIGPTGLFVIEVKSRTGSISVGWESLLINEYQPERDFIDQALSHAFRVRRLLGQMPVPEDALVPLLVFTRATVPSIPPLRGVQVLKTDHLLAAILDAPTHDLPLDKLVAQVEKALAKEP